ncbi:MAG: hypothetical protein ACD_82C00005G0003 [uncultured bacterium]|jgi:hypothetical protein|nr:MAG: hypothetical protein ACD_82C00005G0003 [uncultured bacterium]KKP25070.1 MAG: hypothetical protein UR12_C0046G0003 [candidate division TM6 bacterium GW2011_GWF2_30_66]
MKTIRKLGLLPVLTLSVLAVCFSAPVNAMNNAQKNPININTKKAELNKYKQELREIYNYLESSPGFTSQYTKQKREDAKKLEVKIKELETSIK